MNISTVLVFVYENHTYLAGTRSLSGASEVASSHKKFATFAYIVNTTEMKAIVNFWKLKTFQISRECGFII